MWRIALRLITDWEGYLTGGMTVELEQIRMATQTGRPAGDESFVGKVANLTGRDLNKGKAGRPRKGESGLCPLNILMSPEYSLPPRQKKPNASRSIAVQRNLE